MKIMTEKELKNFDPKEIEGEDVACDGKINHFTGNVLYDYYRGLSITNKENKEHCLVGIHGPGYKGHSNYETKEQYHKDLSVSIFMLRDKIWDEPRFYDLTNQEPTQLGGSTCSFT